MHHKLKLIVVLPLLLIFFIVTAEAKNTFFIENYKGKIVYLDFWASWCGPCRKSFPWMIKMHKKYQDSGLTIVAVNLDEDSKMRDSFLKNFQVNFEIVSDPNGILAEKYKLLGMPYSILFDRSGKIVEKHHGFRQSATEAYEDEIKKYLNDGKQQ